MHGETGLVACLKARFKPRFCDMNFKTSVKSNDVKNSKTKVNTVQRSFHNFGFSSFSFDLMSLSRIVNKEIFCDLPYLTNQDTYQNSFPCRAD